jgi:hypothetical protein
VGLLLPVFGVIVLKYLPKTSKVMFSKVVKIVNFTKRNSMESKSWVWIYCKKTVTYYDISTHSVTGIFYFKYFRDCRIPNKVWYIDKSCSPLFVNNFFGNNINFVLDLKNFCNSVLLNCFCSKFGFLCKEKVLKWFFFIQDEDNK